FTAQSHQAIQKSNKDQEKAIQAISPTTRTRTMNSSETLCQSWSTASTFPEKISVSNVPGETIGEGGQFVNLLVRGKSRLASRLRLGRPRRSSLPATTCPVAEGRAKNTLGPTDRR